MLRRPLNDLRQPDVARLKGMDPADPYFENTEPAIRLDPTDGKWPTFSASAVNYSTRWVRAGWRNAIPRNSHAQRAPHFGLAYRALTNSNSIRVLFFYSHFLLVFFSFYWAALFVDVMHTDAGPIISGGKRTQRTSIGVFCDAHWNPIRRPFE